MAHLDPIATFSDPEVSGRWVPFAERQGGRQVLDLLARNKARHVVVTMVDRIFRNAADGLATVERWSKRGIVLHLADQGGCAINTSTPLGFYMFGQLVLFAQFECGLIAERTSASMKRHQSVGRRMSAEPPMGMCVDPENPSRLIDSPEEQRVIERVIQMASDPAYQRNGKPWKREIARQLDREGHPSRGKGWNVTAVIRILQRASAGTAATP